MLSKLTGERSSTVSEALVLAAFTALGYVAAYGYELGYAYYFDIPAYLVRVTAETVIAASLAIIGFALSIVWLLNVPVALFRRELSRADDLRKRTIIIHICFIAVVVVCFKAFGFQWWIVVALPIIILVMDTFYLFIPWVIDKRKHPEATPFFKRVERDLQSEADDLLTIGVRALDKRIPVPTLAVLFIFMVVLCVAMATGWWQARKQRYFAVNAESKLVLLKRYDDVYVLKGVDSVSADLTDEMRLWTPEKVAEQVFESQKLEDLRASIPDTKKK